MPSSLLREPRFFDRLLSRIPSACEPELRGLLLDPREPLEKSSERLERDAFIPPDRSLD